MFKLVLDFLNKNRDLNILDDFNNLPCLFCTKCTKCENFMEKLIVKKIKHFKIPDENSQVYMFSMIFGIGGSDAKDLSSKMFILYANLFSRFTTISVNQIDEILFFENKLFFFFLNSLKKKFIKLLEFLPFVIKNKLL